uniref:Uncharacterized protein n=1 Tax=Anguilla anguilla TaxID=7936 RepID=A0A0E9RP60_ANGAN
MFLTTFSSLSHMDIYIKKRLCTRIKITVECITSIQINAAIFTGPWARKTWNFNLKSICC